MSEGKRIDPENNGKTANQRLSLPALGFPGEHYSIVLANIFGEPKAHLNATPPEGLPGLYQVTIVLGKPGTRAFPENEIQFSAFVKGTSHLAILAPAFPAPENAVQIRIQVKVESEVFLLDGWPDEAGFLAKLETQPFQATNRNDAEMRAAKAAQCILSEYSAALDIPLQIDLIEVTEEATENKSVTLVSPFLSAGTTIPLETYDAEFANLTSLYREALVSNTPAYRYLCFYKILEVSRRRRERLGRKLSKENRPIRVGEIIPATHPEQVAWLNAVFVGPRSWHEITLNQIFPPEVRGKKSRTCLMVTCAR